MYRGCTAKSPYELLNSGQEVLGFNLHFLSRGHTRVTPWNTCVEGLYTQILNSHPGDCYSVNRITPTSRGGIKGGVALTQKFSKKYINPPFLINERWLSILPQIGSGLSG